MTSRTPELALRLDGSDLDDDGRAALARALRRHLLLLDGVADAAPAPAGSAPAGAKSAGATEWGALVISLVSTGAVGTVVDGVMSWLRRQPTDIAVEIDGQKLSGPVTRQQRDDLVEAYLARVGTDPDASAR